MKESFMQMKQLVFTITLYTTLISVCFAEGGASTGGGDVWGIFNDYKELSKPSDTQARFLKKYLNNSEKMGVKKDLIEWINSLSKDDISEVKEYLGKHYDEVFSLIIKNRENLIDDIKKSPIEIIEKDVVFEDEINKRLGLAAIKAAYTKHERNSTVTYSTYHLSRYNISQQEMKNALICLSFHEFARHFNVQDYYNDLGKACTRINENKKNKKSSLITSTETDKLDFMILNKYIAYLDKTRSERLVTQKEKNSLKNFLNTNDHCEGEDSKNINYQEALLIVAIAWDGIIPNLICTNPNGSIQVCPGVEEKDISKKIRQFSLQNPEETIFKANKKTEELLKSLNYKMYISGALFNVSSYSITNFKDMAKLIMIYSTNEAKR